MKRGFQIWPQNSNRITFDPFFGQKTVENRDIFKNSYKIPILTVFWPKMGLMFFFQKDIYTHTHTQRDLHTYKKIFSKIPKKSLFLIVFWPKKGSNVFRFDFCGQIWNPLIILHILGPHLI